MNKPIMVSALWLFTLGSLAVGGHSTANGPVFSESGSRAPAATHQPDDRGMEAMAAKCVSLCAQLQEAKRELEKWSAEVARLSLELNSVSLSQARAVGSSTQSLQEQLGDMQLFTLTPALGRYFGVAQGVLVLRPPTGQALTLREGDVILAVDDVEVLTAIGATRALRSHEPGRKLNLRLMRQRAEVVLEAGLQ